MSAFGQGGMDLLLSCLGLVCFGEGYGALPLSTTVEYCLRRWELFRSSNLQCMVFRRRQK